MKIILFKFFFLLACGFMLTSCDFSASSVNNSKKADDWQCTEIISQNKVLCQKGNQSVTVTFANLIVPGAADDSAKKFIFEQTFCSSSNYKNYSKEALECVTELLLNQVVKIVPEPMPKETKLTAQVFTSRGTDIAATLIKEGLALVKKKSAIGTYSEYQTQAINLERGIWKSEKVFNDIFNIKTIVDISVDEDQNAQKRKVKGLRRFHSSDLIRAPMLRNADTSKELKSMVVINCKATVKIKINLPPKEYELTIFFRPLTRANIYSGPLSSFKQTEMDWQKKFINAKGGETVETMLEYETLDLNLVTRGNIKVFSGYIVDGYEIKIISNEKRIFKKNGKFDGSKILEKLENTDAVLF